MERCSSCGAEVPDGDRGCQRLFDEVIAREFGDYRYARRHRLTVDTYALQHPERYMRSGKSFVAHLTGAAAALDCDDPVSVNQAVQRWLNGPREVERPAGPAPGRRGGLTVDYVHTAADPEEHLRRVVEWARAAWEAWGEYHGLAHDWIAQASVGTEGP